MGIFETVKTVNGYDIYRLRGSKGVYHVTIREDDGVGVKDFFTFHSIKEAAAFCETL